MDRKEYPPVIEGILPAFYKNIDEEGTTTLIVVPFSMNKSVSYNNITGMAIKIKTISNSVYVATASTTNFNLNQAIFEIKNESLNVGLHYKVLIAYQNGAITGYYSTAGVAKCTNRPVVEIKGLALDKVNPHRYEYTGSYYNEDTTEKVYAYYFNLYDKNLNLIATSGELIHNSTLDEGNGYSIDTYSFNEDLKTKNVYYIEYRVVTDNRIDIATLKYKIVQEELIDPLINAAIVANMNYENGYVELRFSSPKDTSELAESAIGLFKILRTSEESNYLKWDELYQFSLLNQSPSVIKYNDFTVKQGINYKYVLQQFNRFGIASNKSISTEIFVDFEHAFLTDGERLLKIKYNPKVTSFKDIMLETKTNTIGSKYPFIFRNGNVQYKEFPISGLISCLSDESFLFVNEETLAKFDGTVNLTGENISAEREFKLLVLEWLNNGKPKLFRSPTEGNYLVRVLNSSFSPTDGVGRMLHTFSTTASEIGECSYENLRAAGIVKSEVKAEQCLCWRTVELETTSLENINATSLRIEDAPGYKFTLFINNGPLEIVTPTSGEYEIDLSDGIIISSIATNLINGTKPLITYSYWSEPQSKFSLVSNVSIVDSGMLIFNEANENVLSLYNDNKRKIKLIYYLRATKKNSGNDYTLKLNDVIIDITHTGLYEVSNLADITSIAIGDGIYLELLIQYYEYTYSFEDDSMIEAYNSIYNQVNEILQTEYTEEEIQEEIIKAETAYIEYTSELNTKLESELAMRE